MTARQAPLPDGLNRSGNGRGKDLVTRDLSIRTGKDAFTRTITTTPRAQRGIDTSTSAGAALVSPDKPLTDKQKAFVHHWARGETIPSASRKAGYGDGATLAYRMVHMPNILRLYNAEKAAYEASCQMTRKRVMDGLLESIEMAKALSEPASMISGWREVAKLCGYYEPVTKKLEINLTGRAVMNRLDKLSDAELLRLVQSTVLEEASREVIEDTHDE